MGLIWKGKGKEPGGVGRLWGDGSLGGMECRWWTTTERDTDIDRGLEQRNRQTGTGDAVQAGTR